MRALPEILAVGQTPRARAESAADGFAFGTKHPNNRIGMPVGSGDDCGAAAAERAAPRGRHGWWRACGNLQDRKLIVPARLRAVRPRSLKSDEDIIADVIGGGRSDNLSVGYSFDSQLTANAAKITSPER